jgi:hypothetical protein
VHPVELQLPEGIALALTRVGARLNAWVALDAALAGAITGAAVGVATVGARMSIAQAVAAGACTR